MKYFLLVYERSTGRLLDQREFPEESAADASRARFEREAKERTRPDVEVALLSSESLDTLKRTHGRYFYSPRELIENFSERLEAAPLRVADSGVDNSGR